MSRPLSSNPELEERYPFPLSLCRGHPRKREDHVLRLRLDGGLRVARDLRREITPGQYKDRVRAVNEFERQLRDGGYLVLKLFLTYRERRAARAPERELPKVTSKPNGGSPQRTSGSTRNTSFFREGYDDFMEKTGKVVPWHVLDGSKRSLAARDALKLLVEQIDKALEEGRYVGKPFKENFPLLKMPKLAEVDLSPCLTDEDYKKELKKLQKRLGELHNRIYRKKIP